LADRHHQAFMCCAALRNTRGGFPARPPPVPPPKSRLSQIILPGRERERERASVSCSSRAESTSFRVLIFKSLVAVSLSLNPHHHTTYPHHRLSPTQPLLLVSYPSTIFRRKGVWRPRRGGEANAYGRTHVHCMGRRYEESRFRVNGPRSDFVAVLACDQ
jgi:hypothetical protein